MKVRVLTGAILTVLASRGTFAAGEAGATWSAIDAIRASAPSLSQSDHGLGVEPTAPACACEGSEGGDTWSGVASAPAAKSADLPAVANTGTPSALQHAHPGGLPNVYGAPPDGPTVDRIIHIGPKSRCINVDYGESVRFITRDANGAERSFSWRFDVSPEVSSVELNKVAPRDFLESCVRVFVSPNPNYAGG